jgi:hypothetical protein
MRLRVRPYGRRSSGRELAEPAVLREWLVLPIADPTQVFALATFLPLGDHREELPRTDRKCFRPGFSRLPGLIIAFGGFVAWANHRKAALAG